MGSLLAALASFLHARSHGGAWLLRMEDIDPPREVPGAAASIMDSLRQHGLHWDEPELLQSQRCDAYDSALGKLQRCAAIFQCDCTRQLLGPQGSCNGRCQPRQKTLQPPIASRIAVPQQCELSFTDELQGHHNCQLSQQLTDFTLRRKDGLYAYQLAVVVDDAFQHISHIVRGADLLESTPRQILLQQLLGYPTPDYCHLPLLINADGTKLSKQNKAPALDNRKACTNLRTALHYLRQATPPAELNDTASVLGFACRAWSVDSVPATLSINYPMESIY